MTKRDLVVRISKETGIVQEDVYAILQKILDYITESLVKGGAPGRNHPSRRQGLPPSHLRSPSRR